VLGDVPEVASGRVRLVYCPPQYSRVRACQRRYHVRCVVTDNAMAGRPRLGLDLVRHLGGDVPCVLWSGSTQGLADEVASLNRASGTTRLFVRHAADPTGLRRLVADILSGRHEALPAVASGRGAHTFQTRTHELRHTIMGHFLAVDIALQQWCLARADPAGSMVSPAGARVREELGAALDQAATSLAEWSRVSEDHATGTDAPSAHDVASLLAPVHDAIQGLSEALGERLAAGEPEELLGWVRRLGTELQSAVEAVDSGWPQSAPPPPTKGEREP